MKIIYKTRVRKDFANFVFCTLVGIENGWSILSEFLEKKGSEDKLSIPKYNLNNIIHTSTQKASANSLISGDNIRFFIEPFYEKKDFFAYLTTQWRYKGGKNIDIVSLEEFINAEYSDLFQIEIENKEFRLIQKNENIIIKIKENVEKSIDYFSLQKILFGCPGTGKSREILSIKNNLQAKEFKTTFHPDSDYSTFVGAYKPVMRGDDVRYEFMPQVFTKAYTYAWNNPTENVLLVIEEINRGNCAQIFGDLFQCLDRNSNGASEYAIDAEADLAQYLAQTLENQTIVSEFFEANYDGNDCFSKIAFPPNLYIYATMNTSDQSLFPMDSAFKRRWDWQYVPIDYDDAKTLTIKIEEETSYNWGDFITIINRKIYETTQSEDKQLGNRFVNPSDGKTISLEQFRSKVMFYLWSEIYKDEQEKNVFQWKQEADYQLFTFNDLFDKEQFVAIIKSFMEYNNILPIA